MDSKQLSMLLLSNEDGSNGIFVRPESREELSAILGCTKLQRHRNVVDEVQIK